MEKCKFFIENPQPKFAIKWVFNMRKIAQIADGGNYKKSIGYYNNYTYEISTVNCFNQKKNLLQSFL